MFSIVTVGGKFVTSKSVRKFIGIDRQRFLSVMSEQLLADSEGSVPSPTVNFDDVRAFVPKLSSDLRKGQCGRIGVIGGSAEYTGAPFFAAISALKVGADLVHVFCCRAAAPVIKSYSPELIVLPILDETDVVKKIECWLPRLHALVIGPGLGREPEMIKNVTSIISHCSDKMVPQLPLVIDADGLFIVQENLNLIKKYKGPVILTPNGVEYCRLSSKMSMTDPLQIATSLNSVLLQKGSTDVIVNGIQNKELSMTAQDVVLKCDVTGSGRRCGGQGDILSGCLSTFTAWFELHKQRNPPADINKKMKDRSQEEKMKWFKENLKGYSLACYAACAITRTCNRLAFEEFGRSMTATDMIPYIGKAFKSLINDDG